MTAELVPIPFTWVLALSAVLPGCLFVGIA